MLPTREQMKLASTSLLLARDIATMTAIAFATDGEADYLRIQFVEEMKLAAKALGYDLVEIIPQTDAGAGRMG